MIGIYIIKNIINGKVYIGQSWNIEQRIRDHRKNRNHNEYLTKSMNIHGIESFDFSILEEYIECDQIFLNEREAYWINFYNSLDFEKGYNLREAGSRGKHTPEIKKKISEAVRGKSKNGAPSALARRGMKFSEERKEKISKALKGNKNGSHPCSHATKKKIGASKKGIPRSKDCKRKISETKIGIPHRPLTDEEKSKIGEANKNRFYYHNDNLEITKRVKQEEIETLIELGFVYGRKIYDTKTNT